LVLHWALASLVRVTGLKRTSDPEKEKPPRWAVWLERVARVNKPPGGGITYFESSQLFLIFSKPECWRLASEKSGAVDPA
jgi:hypothetical protein